MTQPLQRLLYPLLLTLLLAAAAAARATFYSPSSSSHRHALLPFRPRTIMTAALPTDLTTTSTRRRRPKPTHTQPTLNPAEQQQQRRRKTPTHTHPSSSSPLPLFLHNRGGGGASEITATGSWATIFEGLKNGCASGLAAACAKLLLQPFDTLKTLQQANKGSLGMLEAATDLVNRKGVGALYTGLGVTLVGSIPAVSIYFGVYQASKKAMLQALPPGIGWSLLGVAASAAVGNTIASLFRVPYETVKQRLQAGMYTSTSQAISTMYRTEGGIFAFFGRGGVASQILRDVPYAIVTLLTYESLRRALGEWKKAHAHTHTYTYTYTEKDGKFVSSPFEDMCIGAFAGGVGSLISNPMDVVKTRIMTQPQLYPTVFAAVTKILAEEGAPAFFKGTVPRLLHKVPANAIFFATYEIFRKMLRVHG